MCDLLRRRLCYVVRAALTTGGARLGTTETISSQVSWSVMLARCANSVSISCQSPRRSRVFQFAFLFSNVSQMFLCSLRDSRFLLRLGTWQGERVRDELVEKREKGRAFEHAGKSALFNCGHSHRWRTRLHGSKNGETLPRMRKGARSLRDRSLSAEERRGLMRAAAPESRCYHQLTDRSRRRRRFRVARGGTVGGIRRRDAHWAIDAATTSDPARSSSTSASCSAARSDAGRLAQG